MKPSSFIALALMVSVPLLACSSESSDDPAAGGGGSGATSGAGGKGDLPFGGSGGGAGQSCTATFKWLQKDAYKETAGRSSALWPPHTTTTLEIRCDGSVVRSAYRENHGTLPEQKDANGEVILVEMASSEVVGPRSELEALVDAFELCECGNQFLSMTALGDDKVQALIKEVSDYLTANLTCNGKVDTAGLVQLIQQGDIPPVLAELPNCVWANGADWSTGLDGALQVIITSSQEQLADYHVCNNDAELQAQLFGNYVAAGEVKACDGASVLCAGPHWFYDPTN